MQTIGQSCQPREDFSKMRLNKVATMLFLAIIQTPVVHTFILLTKSVKDPYATGLEHVRDESSRAELWMGIVIAYIFYGFIFLAL